MAASGDRRRCFARQLAVGGHGADGPSRVALFAQRLILKPGIVAPVARESFSVVVIKQRQLIVSRVMPVPASASGGYAGVQMRPLSSAGGDRFFQRRAGRTGVKSRKPAKAKVQRLAARNVVGVGTSGW